MKIKVNNIDKQQVLVSAFCNVCGKWDAPIKMTNKQLTALRAQTELLQNIMPDASPDQRETFISGICGTCWDRTFAEG